MTSVSVRDVLQRSALLEGARNDTLQLSQSELGQLLGGARQSINQLWSTMERDGLITVNGRTIEAVDPVGLRRRADS